MRKKYIVEAAEQRGAEKAWDLAQKICLPASESNMSLDDMEMCFGSRYIASIFRNSYSKATQMYEAWMKKNEIKVGDEITVWDELNHNVNYKVRYIVTKVCADGYIYYVADNGVSGGVKCDEVKIKKTGRHFPEIVELLKKMEGNNNE